MFLRLLVLFIIALPSWCAAQTLELSQTRFEVSGGNIFGATLSNKGTVMYAQQYLSDTSSTGRQRIVKVSSWDIKTKSVLASKLFPESQRSQTLPCKRTIYSVTSGNLYICSDRTSVRILEGKELTTLRKIQCPAEGTIHDFAVDEARDRIYLVADHANGTSTLEVMSLSTAQLEKRVTMADSSLAYSPLAYRSAVSLLVVAFTRSGEFGQKTGLVFYDASTLKELHNIDDLPRIDGLSFINSKLVAAPGYLGFKKHSCLLSFDLKTFISENEFCAPKTGVNFSVTSVSDAYVVAATGVNRPRLFSDVIESTSSSLSIWSIETKKLLATIALPDGFTSALAGVTIVGNSEGCFIAYQSSGAKPLVIGACIQQPENQQRNSLSADQFK